MGATRYACKRALGRPFFSTVFPRVTIRSTVMILFRIACSRIAVRVLTADSPTTSTKRAPPPGRDAGVRQTCCARLCNGVSPPTVMVRSPRTTAAHRQAFHHAQPHRHRSTLRRYMSGVRPVGLKTDRIPRFGARCWLRFFRRSDLGWSPLPPSFLSSSPRTTGPARGWPSRKQAQGWCGPQRSEDTALRVLTDRHCGLGSRDQR